MVTWVKAKDFRTLWMFVQRLALISSAFAELIFI